MKLTNLKYFKKIFCPFCSKEMCADIHEDISLPEADNWYCFDCGTLITPEDLLECIPEEIDKIVWLEKLRKYYKIN